MNKTTDIKEFSYLIRSQLLLWLCKPIRVHIYRCEAAVRGLPFGRPSGCSFAAQTPPEQCLIALLRFDSHCKRSKQI